MKVLNSTGNAKLGNLAVTYASQATCPRDCAFFHNGCYAESGPVSWAVTGKLNKSTDTAVESARAEAKGIDALPADKTLRLHVVGDCATDQTAKIVSKAGERYQSRAKLGAKVYTYTHAWRKVKRASWGKVSVLASCETIQATKEAHARGYAAALVVDQHSSAQSYMLEGMRVIPCPQQTKDNVTCESCRLCSDDQYLKSVSGVIAFEAHGVKVKTVKSTLIQLQA